jgi:hypothetical protein
VNESRTFLSVVIASGLDFEMLTPEDVIRHVTMDILAHHLPPELIAELLEAALQSDTMTATLVLQTLGVESIAEHCPMSVLWACVSEAAAKSLSQGAASPVATTAAAKPAAAAPRAVAKKAKAAVSKARPATVPAPVAASVPVPEPLVEPAPFAQAESIPAARKPNRIAEAPAPMEAMATLTTTAPPAMDTVEVVRHERMETYADEEDDFDNEDDIVEEFSYDDVDTSIGTLEPEVAAVEYSDDKVPYGVEGDEVTAFGHE